MLDFIREAASVVPSKRQLAWFENNFFAFIHFGMNTFTDREWGTGTEAESLFNPSKLDCDQWVDAVRSAGMKGMILVAKHHDGFCLWDTKLTDHSVMNSPFGRDIVREASEACRRGGIRFGFYLSPWDRNSRYYGTPAYNDYFCGQLEELLTNYGEIAEVWFDNACGEGPDGKKQEYDFPRYISLIRRLQPEAVIFNDYGPDARWCGNEAGIARESEWAVVPSELCFYSDVQSGPGPLSEEGSLDGIYSTGRYLGSLDSILYSKGLVFCPSEFDTSIRPGWFWHRNEEPKSVDELMRVYMTTVGNNAGLNLNIPPTDEGLIDERDAARLKEFGDAIKSAFGTPVPSGLERAGGTDELPVYRISFDKVRKDIRHVILREDLTKGQRISEFRIGSEKGLGMHFPWAQGSTVGNCRILTLADHFTGQNPLIGEHIDGVDHLLLEVSASRGKVFLKSAEVY